MVLSAASTDSRLTGSENHFVAKYAAATMQRIWFKVLPQSSSPVNVYFADSDSKVLIVWKNNGFWTLTFLDANDGSQLGDVS